MKFKKIVGFGDSWMWGDELIDPELADHPRISPVLIENTYYREENCFLGMLGRHYRLPYENFGIPGGSLQSTIWTYLWWLQHEQLDPKDCLILVGLTEASRGSYYNPNHVVYPNDPPWNRFVHSAWIHSGFSGNEQQWERMVKDQMLLTDCAELHNLNYLQTVKFFEGQHHLLNQNILQFCTIPPPMLTSGCNLIWPDRTIGSFLKKPDHFKPQRHPNEIGHAIIRNLLIEQIKNVILA
jgi:hypothetical protein